MFVQEFHEFHRAWRTKHNFSSISRYKQPSTFWLVFNHVIQRVPHTLFEDLLLFVLDSLSYKLRLKFDLKCTDISFVANGVSKIKVRVSKKAPTKKPKLGKMKYFGGRTTKNVDPKDTIKIKPKKGVPGRTVLVYKPGKKTVLSLSDVKVYVRPIKTPEEGETPEGPEEEEPETPEGPEEEEPETPEGPEEEEPEEPTEPAETAAPGEPKGPGGPEGPDGPDGPEEGTKPDQPAAGPGTNPAAGNDGNPDTCFKSKKANSPWWSVDLGKTWEVVAVHVKACAESR